MLKKSFAYIPEFLLEANRTIAVAASPGLTAIEVAALAPVMCVLHSDEIEELFPIWGFLLQRRRTITNLDPANFFPRQLPSFTHVPEILALGNGTLPQVPRSMASSNGFSHPVLTRALTK
jgi:hypothetical protein